MLTIDNYGETMPEEVIRRFFPGNRLRSCMETFGSRAASLKTPGIDLKGRIFVLLKRTNKEINS